MNIQSGIYQYTKSIYIRENTRLQLIDIGFENVSGEIKIGTFDIPMSMDWDKLEAISFYSTLYG